MHAKGEGFAKSFLGRSCQHRHLHPKLQLYQGTQGRHLMRPTVVRSLLFLILEHLGVNAMCMFTEASYNQRAVSVSSWVIVMSRRLIDYTTQQPRRL